jgi:hypothetical protein
MNSHDEQFIPGVIDFGHFLQDLKSRIQCEAFAVFNGIQHMIQIDAGLVIKALAVVAAIIGLGF